MPTALPASSEFTANTQDEGDMKAVFSALRDFLAGLLGADGATATALATLGAPLSSYITKSGAYTAVAGDKGKTFDCTGTWTFSLLAAATAADGFTLAVRNSGTGVITIDPNLSETIDGGATLTVNASESLILYCTGTAWVSIGKSSGVPSGAMTAFGGTSAPAGWLMCDGSAVSRTTYASLFTAIGTTFGAGDGSSTFNIPDLRGRVIAGQDDMGGSAASRLTTAGSGVDGATLGAVGGAQNHALTTAELANHTHGTSGMSATLSGAYIGGGATYGVDTAQSGSYSTSGSLAISGSTDAAGSGTAHNNVQPTLVANYIIKT